MRLYHPDNGFHFETSNNVIDDLKKLGWVEAPKGFQKTLNQPVKEEVKEPAKTLGLPPKKDWKA